MFDVFNRMKGSVVLTIRGAFPEGVLNECARCGVTPWSVARLDEHCLRLRVPTSQEGQLRQAVTFSQCEVSETHWYGATAAGRTLRRRWILAAFFALIVALLLWSKAYIWDIEVIGNESVSTGEILAALEECGVEIGSFWPAFTSDNLRSEALCRLPQLRWLTVNVRGSRAEIVVRERVEKPEMLDDSQPKDIVAEKDGFIMEIRALKGNAQVQRGQAVIAGQLLIAGNVPDLRGKLRQLYAYGSVTARTYYELSAVVPVTYTKKCYSGKEESRWSLCLGEERINFYRNSSISTEDCDKIYSVYRFEIPGLFCLPLSLQREELRYYEIESVQRDARLCRTELEQRLHRRLLEETDGGEIISEHYSYSEANGLLTVCLRAECQEDIGKTVPLTRLEEWEREG